eukprot:2935321-Pyramimonas_sp.AAC.1
MVRRCQPRGVWFPPPREVARARPGIQYASPRPARRKHHAGPPCHCFSRAVPEHSFLSVKETGEASMRPSPASLVRTC